MSEISILVAGDYSPKERFQKELDNNLFESLFPGVKEVISSCDYSVVNFESTIPTQDSRPIDKIVLAVLGLFLIFYSIFKCYNKIKDVDFFKELDV